MTPEQMLLELQAAKVDCPACLGRGWYEHNGKPTGLHVGCTACGGSGGEVDIQYGTGKVPKYPGLFVPCENLHNHDCSAGGIKCPDCGRLCTASPGVLPDAWEDVTLEALLTSLDYYEDTGDSLRASALRILYAAEMGGA